MDGQNTLRFRYEAFANFITQLNPLSGFAEINKALNKHAKYFLQTKFLRFAFRYGSDTVILQSGATSVGDNALTFTPFEEKCFEKAVPRVHNLDKGCCPVYEAQVPVEYQKMFVVPKIGKRSKLVISTLVDENGHPFVYDRIFLNLLSEFLDVKLSERYLVKSLADKNTELEDAHEEVLMKSREIEKINAEQENIIERRTQELKQQNDLLKKHAFINSHNIRGPLTSIMGLLDLLKDVELNAEVESLLAMLSKSAKKLDDEVRNSNELLSEIPMNPED